MAWFKVDDKLHSHTKAARAGVDAMGLWVLCGSWSADQLTDGFVPDYIALRLDPKARSKAARLVSAGLWNVAEKGDDRGWSFHDWADMQPTRADVESKREREREKKRKWREKAGRGGDGRFTTGDDAMSPGESLGESTGDTLGSPVGSPPVSRPDPTRPDPTLVKDSPALPRGTRITEDWTPSDALMDWAEKDTPNVDVQVETDNFVDYWLAKTGKDATKLDWGRTWQRWMRTAESRVPAWKREPRRLADDSWDRYRYDPDTLEGA